MIEQIRALREQVPVSIPLAKEILGTTRDLAEAIEKAREIYAQPLTSRTKASVDEACAALAQTKGDVEAALELIAWKSDFAAKERASRPTKTRTRKIIRGTQYFHELMEATRTQDDLTCYPADTPEVIIDLLAINMFEGLYLGDDDLLFSEYRDFVPRIIAALRSAGIHRQADLLEQELEHGAQSQMAFQEYLQNEQKYFRALRAYCEANLDIVHGWIYRAPS